MIRKVRKVESEIIPDFNESSAGKYVRSAGEYSIFESVDEFGDVVYRCFRNDICEDGLCEYEEAEYETDDLDEAVFWARRHEDDEYDDEGDLVVDYEEGCQTCEKDDEKEVLVEDSDDPVDYLDKNDLGNLIKSAGGDVDGSESEDELRGMYKVMATNESFKRRAIRVASAKKSVKENKQTKTESGLIQGNVGGMKIELILEFPQGDTRVDGDAVCEDVVEAISSNDFGNIRVPDGTDIDINKVTFTELPRTMFESKPVMENLPKYKGKYNKKPDECTPYVLVRSNNSTEPETYYTYDKMEDAKKVADDIYNNPDEDVYEVSHGVITTGPDFRENVSSHRYIHKDDESAVKENKIPKSKFVKNNNIHN